MTKAARTVAIALAAVVLLLVVTMLLLESPWARNIVENQVSQRLNGREVEIGDLEIDWGWPPTIRVEEVRVANPDWARHEHMLNLAALEATPDLGALLQGNVALERLHLERPVIHLARRQDGTTSWAGLMGDGGGGGGAGIRPGVVSVDQGHLTYRDPARDTDITLDFSTQGEGGDTRQLTHEARGQLRGLPLRLSGRGGAPSRLLAEEASTYSVTLEGRLGQIQASFDGQLREALQLEGLEGQLMLSAPDTADVGALVERPELDLPALDFHGQLRYQEQQWALQDFRLRLGESQVSGSLSVALGETPRIEAQLSADQLRLERWGITDLGSAEERQQVEQEIEQEIEQLTWEQRWAERLAPLLRFEAQVDLSVGRLSYGDTVLRDVALVGQIEQGRLRLQRLHLAQGEGELTAQGWLEVQEGMLRGDIDAHLTQVDLGQALAPLGFAELGTLGGRLHVRLVDGTLVLDDTSLDYRAPAQEITIHVEAETVDITGEAVPGVSLEGSGTYRQRPFAFDLIVGPLLDLDNPDEPYPVQGEITTGDTTLYIDGTIRQPLEIASVNAFFRLSGPNPARLNRLTGLNFPALPPYRIQGQLRVEDDLVRLLDLRGRFGNSDVNGDVRIRLGERPMLWATLGSQQLDLDDLAPLAGAAPETGDGEAASPTQRQRARMEERQPGIFSDREWNLEGLRRMDARVIYHADTVIAQDIPLTGVELELTMDEGVLVLEPLRVGLGSGVVIARVRLDARGTTLRGRLELAIREVNLKPLLRRAELSEVATDSAGIIAGQGQLRFYGDSMDEAMAHLSGQLELAMSGGQLGVLAVEALGLDVGEALTAALVGAADDEVPIDCAYARFEANDGLALLEQFFMATKDSNVTGGGAINLDEERMALVFEAHPKDPSLLASDSPVSLEGPLGDLRVDIISTELVARGILSVIGALVAPPLAILPWIELGTGEGAGPGCRSVLSKYHAPASEE